MLRQIFSPCTRHPDRRPRDPAEVILKLSHRDPSPPSHKTTAAGDCVRDDTLLRSISRVGALPRLRSCSVSRREPTQLPVRAKYLKESGTERLLVLAESQSAIR